MELRRTIKVLVDEYEDHRVIARQTVETELADTRIKLTGMNGVLAAQADFWKGSADSYRPGVDWSWTAKWSEYRRKPKNFNLCILFAGTLCGLSLGQTSHHGTRVRLELFEGNPQPAHPLRRQIVPITLACAEMYARRIAATQVRIMRPFTGVVDYYRTFGFHFVPAGRKQREMSYLYKDLP